MIMNKQNQNKKKKKKNRKKQQQHTTLTLYSISQLWRYYITKTRLFKYTEDFTTKK